MSATNIIKADGSNQRLFPAGGVIKRPLIDAHTEARRILEEARAEAASTREQAETSARELREAAYREGLEAALLEINQHVLAARELRETALAEVERDVLRLSVKLAEKIIGHEIERDSATIADIVSNALKHARRDEMLTIRVNSADLASIEEHRERLDPTGRARLFDILPDPRIARGGCLIESESGTINAQLDVQLRVLERALLARAAGDDR